MSAEYIHAQLNARSKARGNATPESDSFFYQIPAIHPFWITVPADSPDMTPAVKGKIPLSLKDYHTSHAALSPRVAEQENLITHLRNPATRTESLARVPLPSIPLKKVQAHFAQKADTLGEAFIIGPHWRGTLGAQCGPWIAAQCDAKRKKAAEAYCAHLRYIPHDEFVTDLVILYRRLQAEGVITDRTYFVVSERSSNEYCAILLQRLVDPRLSERILYMNCGRIGYTPRDFYQEVIRLVREGDGEGIQLMELDDMTYSGSQALNYHLTHYLQLYAGFYPPQLRGTYLTRASLATAFMDALGISHHAAFVYATAHAVDLLQERGFANPFDDWRTIPRLYPLHVHVGEIFPSVRAAVGENMFRALGAYFGWPSTYGSKTIAPDALVYFDHKIADPVSVMGMPLLTGRLGLTEANLARMAAMAAAAENGDEVPGVAEWVNEYVRNGSTACSTDPVPLIPSCAMSDVEDGSPYTYPEERCPPAWYKYFPEETGAFRLGRSYRAQYPRLVEEKAVKGGLRSAGRSKRRSTRRRAHRPRNAFRKSVSKRKLR